MRRPRALRSKTWASRWPLGCQPRRADPRQRCSTGDLALTRAGACQENSKRKMSDQ